MKMQAETLSQLVLQSQKDFKKFSYQNFEVHCLLQKVIAKGFKAEQIAWHNLKICFSYTTVL